eukprot:328534_1
MIMLAIIIIVICFNTVVIWSATYQSGSISSPFTLHRGDKIESVSNTEVYLRMQLDGNLVFRAPLSTETSVTVWSTNDEGAIGGSTATLQDDGDLVMFNNHSEAIWNSSSSLNGLRPFMLMVSANNDVAMLYILDSSNNIIWSRSSDNADNASLAPASYPTRPPYQLFPIDETVIIWNYDMQTMDGWTTNDPNTGGAVALFNNSEKCIQCIRLTGDDGIASIEKQTNISEYKTIQFTVDIMHWGSSGSKDYSVLEYKYDNDPWSEYKQYGMDINKQWTFEVIHFNIPPSTQSLTIRISVETTRAASLNKCFVDNAILMGVPIDTGAPTAIPSTFTLNPTNVPTLIESYQCSNSATYKSTHLTTVRTVQSKSHFYSNAFYTHSRSYDFPICVTNK